MCVYLSMLSVSFPRKPPTFYCSTFGNTWTNKSHPSLLKKAQFIHPAKSCERNGARSQLFLCVWNSLATRGQHIWKSKDLCSLTIVTCYTDLVNPYGTCTDEFIPSLLSYRHWRSLPGHLLAPSCPWTGHQKPDAEFHVQLSNTESSRRHRLERVCCLHKIPTAWAVSRVLGPITDSSDLTHVIFSGWGPTGCHNWGILSFLWDFVNVNMDWPSKGPANEHCIIFP